MCAWAVGLEPGGAAIGGISGASRLTSGSTQPVRARWISEKKIASSRQEEPSCPFSVCSTLSRWRMTGALSMSYMGAKCDWTRKPSAPARTHFVASDR